MNKHKLDVYSPAKGVVKYALKDLKSDYGRRVYIEYDTCIMLFAHLESFIVREGQEIRPGELLGTMGNTGYGDDVHLEYAIDPTFFLKLSAHYVTNSKISNGFGSKYCNPKLKGHEGVDYSGTNMITGWTEKVIDPLFQDYRLKNMYPEEYK